MTHALEPERERHQERHRPDAVGHHLDGLGAGDLAHGADGGRIVVRRDVVEGELRRAGGQRRAGAVVEQPHVVALRVEVLGQVLLGGVEQEGGRGVAEAGSQDHRTLRAAVEAGQPQLDVVVGAEEVRLARAARQRAVLARSGVRDEGAGPREDAAEGLVEGPGEHPAERRHRLELVERAAADPAHRRHLLGEVGRVDGDDALGRDRTCGALALVDGDVEGRRVGPEVHAVLVADLLVAVEVEAAAVVGDQRHGVEHLAGAGVLGVADEQVEATALDLQRRGGEGGGGDGAGEVGLVVPVADQRVDVVGGHGDGELQRRLVGLAAVEPCLVVVESGRGDEAPHRLGEPHPGAAHVTLPSSTA